MEVPLEHPARQSNLHYRRPEMILSPNLHLHWHRHGEYLKELKLH
jgi:hypothetical protein